MAKAKAQAPATVQMYALCCPESGDVRYIGKAKDSGKRFVKHLADARRRKTPVYCWISSLAKRGMRPSMHVIEDSVPSDVWEDVEIRLIAEARARGDRILNVADGGNAPFCPRETRSVNGKKTSRKHPIVWWLLKTLGTESRRRDKTGGDASHLRSAADRLRAMSDCARDFFCAEWVRRGNYHPGKSK